MRYLTFSPNETGPYPICFLVPTLHQADMERIYIKPHFSGREKEILAYDLFKEKRTPVTLQREYLDELLDNLTYTDTKYLVTCDAEYFKTLTKSAKAEATLGYVVPCVHPGYEHLWVAYCPNFRAHWRDPDKISEEIRIALSAVKAHIDETYIAPGLDIIKFAAYPMEVNQIELWLQRLLNMNCPLSADIETFSLKHHDAGIGTISFSWNKHEGIAFPVDLHFDLEDQIRVRALLKKFFISYAKTGHKALWHNISFDVYVLIYQLFMKDLLDTEGLLYGMDILLDNWEDTKLITYLATNSVAGNMLGLKHQAQEFAGNYAVENITDIRSIPLEHLLRYNLVDALSTWFVYEKHYDTMVADDQLTIYETLFKPAIKDIIQMQLTGLPIDMSRVETVHPILQAISQDAKDRMDANPLIKDFVAHQTERAWEKDFADRKNKAKNPDKIKAKDFATFPTKPFNPNSTPQLQEFLYEKPFLELPVIEKTKTKLPATDGDTLEKLLNHVSDPAEKDFLEALIDFKAIEKLLTAFFPHFLSATEGPDGWHYLFGNFNLGGTISGRLSSSDPNLQNLPANVTMKITDELLKRFPELSHYVKKGRLILGKLVKSCFAAPPGKIFCGLDFASLEDRISALTTKDPNKLKVYTDGFDGHCLRAYSYFGDMMSNNINPDDPESINSISDLYPDLRQKSKTPTFALTYQGTYITLMNGSGFTQELAKKIEAAYHDLYRVSDQWVAERIAEAGQKGYVTVAFGLRLRTPLLRQVILGTSRTPYEAEAEGRSAGNALGQSWCLLNTRASVEFMTKVRSGKYRLNIRPCAHIHDAQYMLIDADLDVFQYVNEHLVKAVEWQDHPDIQHDTVKLGGELSIFWPDWSNELVIPNEASAELVQQMAEKFHADYHQKYSA